MSRTFNSREWNAQQMKIHFTVRERLALEDIQRMAGLPCIADVVRLALQNLADHYDVRDSLKLFGYRKRRDPRKASAA